MSPLIGLVAAWLFIIVGMIMKGGTIAGIINLPAFLMVIGGTTCVLIASFGMKETIGMIQLSIGSLKELPDRRPELIRTLVGFSEKARREGLLVLEEDAKQVDDPFLGKGVRLVVDGTDPELVKDILETELDSMEERHHKNQEMFKQGGAFAPTIGILATVLSLVSVLMHLDEPDTLGPHISAAFLATFYGVAVANVVYLPIDQRPEEEDRAGVRRAPAHHRGRPVHPERRQPPHPGREAVELPAARRPRRRGRRGGRRRDVGRRAARRRRRLAMAKRKQRHEEHPDERWLITYADVLTLMYVLFMVLFAISSVNTNRFELLKQSLTDAFNSGLAAGGTSVLDTVSGTPAPVVDTPTSQIAPEVPSVGGISLSDASPGQILETKQLQAAEKAIDANLKQQGLAGTVTTSVNERGLAVRIKSDGVLFDPGAAVLKPAGASIVAPIAASLKGLPNPIRVEGHTDSTPIHTAQFPSNFALSGVRAAAVVVAMQAAGIPEKRLQVAGYGDTRPVADNDTAEGRSQNRRVEILILRLQGAPGQSPASALGGG